MKGVARLMWHVELDKLESLGYTTLDTYNSEKIGHAIGEAILPGTSLHFYRYIFVASGHSPGGGDVTCKASICMCVCRISFIRMV